MFPDQLTLEAVIGVLVIAWACGVVTGLAFRTVFRVFGSWLS